MGAMLVVVGCCSSDAPSAASNGNGGKSFIQQSPSCLGARTVIRFHRVPCIGSCDQSPSVQSASNGETKWSNGFIRKRCRVRTSAHIKGCAMYDICQGRCLSINPETSLNRTAGKLTGPGNCMWIMIALSILLPLSLLVHLLIVNQSNKRTLATPSRTC